MEKVKVTKEVGMALKDLFARGDKDYSHDEILNLHTGSLKGDVWTGEKWKYLNRLSMLEMARALLIGYEVEEEYKVGDKLFYFEEGEFHGQIFTVNEIIMSNGNIMLRPVESIGTVSLFHSKNVRHATPEEIKAEQERRVWAGIGREVNEWRKGDVYVHRRYAEAFAIDHKDALRLASERYEEGLVIGIYPYESFISFGGESHDN